MRWESNSSRSTGTDRGRSDMTNKTKARHWVALVFSLVVTSACDPLGILEFEELGDPNNPTVSGVLRNATRAELQNLVSGLESRQRGTFTAAIQAFGSFGRELWYLHTDLRSTTDLLGQNGLQPYPDLWGTPGTYSTPYGAIKQANLLIEAVDNTSAVNATEAAGYKGFARTIAGLQYLTPLNAQYENGIRIDVADPLNPGPFLDYQTALQRIREILDEGERDLRNAGDRLAFGLTSGFDGFDTPEGLRKFNRAIAARAAVYARDWPGALEALAGSFFDLYGDLDVGPRAVFGNPPDIFNPLYYSLNTSAVPLIGVHPSVIEDALPGDRRIEVKFAQRTTPLNTPRVGAPITHQPRIWASPTAPIPIIRNEELILIYAEANAHLGNIGAAVEAINVIRRAWALPDYDGPTNLDALIDEILFQRRYSLWGEAHRWIDLRRYGRLDEIPVHLDNGTVFVQLARPGSETSWEDLQGR